MIDEERFYATGFSRARSFAEADEEVRNDERTGSVIYYDGSTARLLLDGLGMANGINLSPDKRYMFLYD